MPKFAIWTLIQMNATLHHMDSTFNPFMVTTLFEVTGKTTIQDTDSSPKISTAVRLHIPKTILHLKTSGAKLVEDQRTIFQCNFLLHLDVFSYKYLTHYLKLSLV